MSSTHGSSQIPRAGGISRRGFFRTVGGLGIGFGLRTALQGIAGTAFALAAGCGNRLIAGFAAVNPRWAPDIANRRTGEISVQINPDNLRIAKRIDIIFSREYRADTRYREAVYRISFPDIGRTFEGRTMDSSETEITLNEEDVEILRRTRPDGLLQIRAEIVSAGDWYFNISLKQVAVRSWMNTLEIID